MTVNINADYLDTYEAYSTALYLSKGRLHVPYINLGLLKGNCINGKTCSIDYSYAVFEGISKIESNTICLRFNKHSSKINEQWIVLGRFNNEKFVELNIEFVDSHLVIPPTSHIIDAQSYWHPKFSRHREKNMDELVSSNFFDSKSIKQNLGIDDSKEDFQLVITVEN